MADDRDPIRHEATVSELRAVLADSALKATDLLIPNSVRNLAVVRDGQYIGFINMLNGHIGIEWASRDE